MPSRLWAAVRSEPFRLFFPLAALLGALGVGTWIWWYLGWQAGYHGQAHALAQSQSFLMAFVVGFLMTMIPRRLQAAPASTAEIVAAGAGLVGAAAFAFAGQWLLSQLAALTVLATLATFGVRRFRAAPGRRMPDAFVLLPCGILSGIGGGLLIAAGQVGAPSWTVAAGRGLVQEAQFLLLILGAGHLVLPILTGYDPPRDGDDSPGSRRRRLAHLGVAAAIVTGVLLGRLYPMSPALVRLGLLVPVLAFLADGLGCMHAHRRPRVEGLHRRVALLSFWLVPAGLLLAAIVPLDRRVGALHVTFIGGFALLSFAVAAHVIGSHGGFPGIVSGRPWPVWVFGILFLFAATTRVTADFWPKSYAMHLFGAALVWMIALVAWAGFLVPKALRPPPPKPAPRDLPVLPVARPGDHC